jgi:putative transposase
MVYQKNRLPPAWGLGSDIMPCPSPLLHDTYYHIYNRGNNRENIFIQERNYQYFLHLYSKYIDPIADTFAYCLLRNHFHLAVRIKSEEDIIEFVKTLKVSFVNQPHVRQEGFVNPNSGQPGKPLGSAFVSKQFSNFFNSYAKSINHAYGRTGSLFQHPFGRIPIASDRQFWNVIA